MKAVTARLVEDWMHRAAATAGSVVFFVVAPGFLAGVVPFWLTGWQFRTPLAFWAPFRVLGAALLAIGIAVLIRLFAQFVAEGRGTPAPIAPPQRLVVGGLYRYVRNPMYLAVAATVVGQSLLFGQPRLLAYAATFLFLSFCFVRLYEEPTLQETFGAAYKAYRSGVPGWWPRWSPWLGGSKSF
jgi:protein-S-isoprenylcysteine O-methyltransferase Ste14